MLAFLFVVAATAVACDAGDASDPQPPTGESDLLPVMPTTRVVYTDAFVSMRTDLPSMTNAQAATVAREIEDAYAFDAAYQSWTGRAELAPSLETAVVSYTLGKQVTGQASGGIAWDKDSFFVDESILMADPGREAMYQFVVAHELEHLEMERLGASEPAVPVYAFEGIACMLGNWYVALRNHPGARTWLHGDAVLLATKTATDAEDMFTSFATGYGDAKKLYWYEHLGGFFFEFVRAHVISLQSEVLKRWGALTLDVAAGTAFERAFEKAYGTKLSDAQTAFAAHLTATQNDARARFKGTVWEGYE